MSNNKISKNKKISSILVKIFFSLFYFSIISLITSFTHSSQYLALTKNFIRHSDPTSHRFTHTEINYVENIELDTYNKKSLDFVRQNKTDFVTFSTYLTLQNDNKNTFNFDSVDFNNYFSAKVMWLPFRFDINRTYMESIRLRQYRTDVDSRIVKEGYDFSFYITSKYADRLIENNSNILNYDDILDYQGHGLSFNIRGTEYIGHISNIVYIENSNIISVSLDYYLENFIILQGPIDVLFPSHTKQLNYDFLKTTQAIIKNLNNINKINFGDIKFFDERSIESVELKKIYTVLFKGEGVFSSSMITISSTIFVISSFLWFIIFRLNSPLFSKRILEIAIINLVGLLFYHISLKILSHLTATSLFSYLLSNIYFGIFSILMIAFIFTYLIIFYYRLERYRVNLYETDKQKY